MFCQHFRPRIELAPPFPLALDKQQVDIAAPSGRHYLRQRTRRHTFLSALSISTNRLLQLCVDRGVDVLPCLRVQIMLRYPVRIPIQLGFHNMRIRRQLPENRQFVIDASQQQRIMFSV
jgi:hypothetical protein